MKRRIIFGTCFLVSFFFLVIYAEAKWTIPLCLGGMILSAVLGQLWKEMKIMQIWRIDNVRVEIYNAEMTEREVKLYIDRAKLSKPSAKLIKLELVVDGENVDMTSEFEAVPFERIRRITGYLVGKLDRFNSAKRAEVEDRVSHADRDFSEIEAR